MTRPASPTHRQMRVGLNAYFLRHPRTGSGQYLLHLLEAAPSQLISYTLYRLGAEPADRISDKSGTPSVGLQPPSFARGENLAKLWFEQVALPRAASTGKVDVLHYPYWAAPLRPPRVPVVVTIHDIIPLLLPAYRGGPPVRAYTALVARAARSARQIIADSECSRRDIIRALGIPAERVHVVYLAAEQRYHPPQAQDAEKIVSLRARFGLAGRFVLYLGGLDVRKNVPALVEGFSAALRRLRQAGDSEPCQLVIASDFSRTGSSFFPDPRPLAQRLGLVEGQDISYPGAVPDDRDKVALLQAATVFAFPSEYEGFGLPPLEAMACGTPVVCSNGGSLPEIAGTAALTHRPDDIDGLATALHRVLSNEQLRGEMRARGLEQAATFSWTRCAAETRAVYDLAIDGA